MRIRIWHTPRRRPPTWVPTPEQQAKLDQMSLAFAKQGITVAEAIRRMEHRLR